MGTYQELLAQARGDFREAQRVMSTATESELLQPQEHFRSIEYHAKCSDIHFRASVFAREEKDWQLASLWTDWYLRFWRIAYLNYFRSEYRVTGLICLLFMAMTGGASLGFAANAASYGQVSILFECVKGATALGTSGVCAGVASHFYGCYQRLGQVTESYHPYMLQCFSQIEEPERISLEAVYRAMRW